MGFEKGWAWGKGALGGPKLKDYTEKLKDYTG